MSAVTISNNKAETEATLKTNDSLAAKIVEKFGSDYFVQLIGEKEIEAKLAEVAIETMKEIAKDSHDRLLGKFNNPLSKGCHFRVDYFAALKKKGQPAKARLDSMVKQHLFFHGMAPSQYFHFVPDKSMPTGYLPEYYQLDSGKSASKGLEALRNGVTLLGSEAACQIAYYTAVQKVLGDEKFDELFGLKAKWPLMIGWGKKLPKGLFNPFCSIMDVPTINEMKDLKKGQIIGFEGARVYRRKHLVGKGENYTVICIEEGTNPKFRGLSLDPDGVTTQQIAQRLFDSFNADPIDIHEIFSKEICSKICDENEVLFRAAPILKNSKITMETFQSQGGGKCALNTGMCFEISRIVKLARMSIPQACHQLAEWQKVDVIAFGGESK